MSSVLDNSYFYISIFSSMCFVASEILPFLPNKSNGILHAVLLFFDSYNKTKNEKNEKIEKNEKVEKIEKEQEIQNSMNENIMKELNTISSKIDKLLIKGSSIHDS